MSNKFPVASVLVPIGAEYAVPTEEYEDRIAAALRVLNIMVTPNNMSIAQRKAWKHFNQQCGKSNVTVWRMNQLEVEQLQALIMGLPVKVEPVLVTASRSENRIRI